ncbi:MAG TPA: DUF6282 family protein [Thermodesulfobacteriota bacterium]|nr:DUF6282 family protein [Thermodesulfobacteriota bacterium]
MDPLRRMEKPIFDLHVHVGPELLSRRYTVETLAEEAQREFFGFAAKNHFQPTTAWTSRISHHYPIPMMGSITLNKGVGGINPEAVRAALSGLKADPLQMERGKGRFIVWMPTIHAEAHLVHNRRKDILSDWGCSVEYQRTYAEGEGLTVRDPRNKNRISRETREVLKIVASEDLILATGHLSSGEVDMLVKEALTIGVKRIILTHPFYQATDMPIEKQVELSQLRGVFIELAYANLSFDKIPIETYAELIRAAGAHRVILSSDLGQPNSEPVGSGWKNYRKLLAEQGISEKEMAQMSVENPHQLASGEI